MTIILDYNNDLVTFKDGDEVIVECLNSNIHQLRLMLEKVFNAISDAGCDYMDMQLEVIDEGMRTIVGEW